VTGKELESTVKEFIPDAELLFDESIKTTPLINDQDDRRIREEIDFHPRSFKEGVRSLINDARISNNLPPLKN